MAVFQNTNSNITTTIANGTGALSVVGNLSVIGNTYIQDNLTVDGNVTYINITELNVEDPIISLGRGPNNTPLSNNDGKDRGTALWYYETEERTGFYGWSNATGNLFAAVNVSIVNEVVTVTNWGNINLGNVGISGNLSVSGNVTANNATVHNYINANIITATGNVYGVNIDVTGNIRANNMLANTDITATGNVIANNASVTNYLLANIITATGNVYGVNIDVTGNIRANNMLANIDITATGNVIANNASVTNYLLANIITATGNIVGTNVHLSGLLSANGNVVGANLFTAGLVSANGNIIGANLNAVGLSLSGNVLSNINSVFDITTTANIFGGNLLTSGQISTSGNLSANNASITTSLTANIISASGNVTGANVYTGNVSLTGNVISNLNVTGNVTAANIFSVAYVSAAANVEATFNVVAGSNVQAGNLRTTGLVSAQGNVTAADFFSSGVVSAVGNVISGNVFTGGQVSAVGNVTGNNLHGVLRATFGQGSNGIVWPDNPEGGIGDAAYIQWYSEGGENTVLEIHVTDNANDNIWLNASGGTNIANVLSVSGNIHGANIMTLGFVSAQGNVTGNYLFGNLACATGISTNKINNGTSEVNIGTSGGNANITIGGTSNVVVVTTTGILANGIVSASGDITGNDIDGLGNIIAQGNVQGANIFTTGLASVQGNVYSANLFATGMISALSTVIGANLQTSGIVSSLGNILTSNLISAQGNVTGSNLFTSGIVSAQGNITGNNIFGIIRPTGGTGTAGIIFPPDPGGGTNDLATIQYYAVTGEQTVLELKVTNDPVGSQQDLIYLNATGGTNVATSLQVSGFITATGNINSNIVNANSVVGTNLSVISTGDISLSTTGNINVNNANIIGLPSPTQASEATNKAYVDNFVSGLNVQDAVKAATPANLATISVGTVTYNNGTLGVGANLVTTGTYTTIDGVNIASAGTRILVFNEANATHNGIYTYTSSTVLTRATDFDTVAEIEPGDFVFVTNGGTYGNTGWVQTATITSVGSPGNNIVFSQFSGAGTYTAGTGLTLTGTSFSVNASQTQITAVGTLGSLSVSGTVTAGNVSVGTGNISGGNLSVSGNVTGNTSGFKIGYLEIPQATVSGSTNLALTDSGKHLYSANTTATLTIPPNSSTPFAVGTAITVVQEGTNSLTIARGVGVTLYLAGNSTSTDRTLSNFGMATLLKTGTDTWYINGVGLA